MPRRGRDESPRALGICRKDRGQVYVADWRTLEKGESRTGCEGHDAPGPDIANQRGSSAHGVNVRKGKQNPFSVRLELRCPVGLYNPAIVGNGSKCELTVEHARRVKAGRNEPERIAQARDVVALSGEAYRQEGEESGCNE